MAAGLRASRAGIGRRLGSWLQSWAGLTEAEPPAPPPGLERDLLAEERRSPARRWWRRWTGSGRGRLRPVFLLALLAGLLWLGLQAFPGSAGVDSSEGEYVGFASVLEPAPAAAGSAGDPGLLARASRYGTVLESAGPGGLPVIEHDVTREIREVTEVELDFPAGQPFEPLGPEGLVWHPGPRGLGLWWWEDPLPASVRQYRQVSRSQWLRWQQAALQAALNSLAEAMAQLERVDFAAPQLEPEPYRRAYKALSDLRRRHPEISGAQRYWAAIPAGWQCDPELMADLMYGAGGGCPTLELTFRLTEVWVSYGRAAERYEELARRGLLLTEMSPIAAEELGLAPRLFYSGLEGQRDLAALEGTLRALDQRAELEGLAFSLEWRW